MNTLGNETNLRNNFSMSVVVDPTLIFGPQRDSLFIVLPITITYALIFLTGLFGNIFTCIVIIRNKSMHTATNYYLFSLAISDLLLLVSGMPQEMYSIWSKWPYVFGHTFCLLRGLAAETSTNASVLTITLFTIERYLAICHPFVSHKMSKLSRATKHVMMLWVAAFGLALPQALQFGVRNTRGVIMCLQTRVIIEHSFEMSTFFFFLAPMVLISVLYSLIGLRLKTTSLSKQTKEKEQFERNLRFMNKIRRKNSQSTKRVVKMLVAVVIAFFICWAPFHAQRLVAIYGTGEEHLARSPVLLFVYSTLTYISGVFYYMSTCINPIFYHIMSNKFREAFKNTMMQCCCRKREGRTIQRCSYTAIAFARQPNSTGTVNSGNSLKNESSKKYTTRTHNTHVLDSRDKMTTAISQWHDRHCDVCTNLNSVNGQKGKMHHKQTSESTNEPNIRMYQRNSKERKARVTELTPVTDTPRFFAPVCCSNQESPSEMFSPPIPEPVASNNSDDNKTQYYTNEPHQRNSKERKARVTELTLVTDKPRFFASVCCSNQESPSEMFSPPIPEPVASNSSDDNKTQYYPNEPHQRNGKERKARVTELTPVTDRPRFFAPVCCSNQESPSETFSPPIPEPVASNSSDDNKTEYYPNEPEKCINEIKLTIFNEKKTVDKSFVNR